MSLIEEINRASSRVNSVEREINTNVQKVTRVTGQFENAVGNYNQSIRGLNRTISRSVNQFKTIQSGIGKIIGIATNNQPGQVTRTPGVGGGGTSRGVSNVGAKGEGTGNIAGVIADGMSAVGVVQKNISNVLNNIGGIFNGRGGYRSIERSIESIRGPLSSINGEQNLFEKITSSKDSLKSSFYTFPADLTRVVDTWMDLEFWEYRRPNSAVPGEDSLFASISLPIPLNYGQRHGVRIDPADLGILGLGGADSIEQVIKSYTNGENIVDLITAQGDLIRQKGMEDVRSGLTYGAFSTLETVAPRVGGLVGQSSGQIPNPHPTVFFKGVELRTFEFSWKLVPRSEDESLRIKEIISLIKVSVLPEKNNFMLRYPKLLKPVFQGKSRDYLGIFKRSMVTNLEIDYAPDGMSSFFYDGAPVSIMLRMTLQEVEQFLSNDVQVGTNN